MSCAAGYFPHKFTPPERVHDNMRTMKLLADDNMMTICVKDKCPNGAVPIQIRGNEQKKAEDMMMAPFICMKITTKQTRQIKVEKQGDNTWNGTLEWPTKGSYNNPINYVQDACTSFNNVEGVIKNTMMYDNTFLATCEYNKPAFEVDAVPQYILTHNTN